jgi:maltooligosyltrehalose trehalohydrolase
VSRGGFHHRLPFGAEPTPAGTRFRIWAPSADALTLRLPHRGVEQPMRRTGRGWFELETDAAGPGDAYVYCLGDQLEFPDPAARAQADDVHGPSLVVDPATYEWQCADWRGRPWTETVLYELHTGTFTPEGTFDGVRGRLRELKALGITAIELMPVADFPGQRNWGYDGVLPFAPDRAYGSPDALKRLIDAAHQLDMMVFLDVVYNHFGPDGNYLHVYAKEFFTDDHQTPWGAAIDFGRPEVREFFIQNTLYWLEEFRFDGLRFDAVHAIHDDWRPSFLDALGERVRATCGDRLVHLVLENDANEARFMRGAFQAQWNDDIHHAYHVALTGETGGYYGDYRDDPVGLLGRALAEGFIYQGEPSAHRDGEHRGEPSGDLPPTAFVSFMQNHDQVGNRAMGERLAVLAPPAALQAMTTVMLLAPQVPMLFMGEEHAATEPFLYFCDFHDELAEAVREGRRREFRSFPEFADEAARAAIPDPNAISTFERSRPPAQPTEAGARHHELVKTLLRVRRERIVPHLAGAPGGRGRRQRWGGHGLSVHWTLANGVELALIANLGDHETGAPDMPDMPDRPRLFAWPPELPERPAAMPPWSVMWFLHE